MIHVFAGGAATARLGERGIICIYAYDKQSKTTPSNASLSARTEYSKPVTIETGDPNWAANTTLDVEADFYVANRGDNTIVRMRQDGSVVAVRRVRLAGGKSLGNLRLNGIAGSPDGTQGQSSSVRVQESSGSNDVIPAATFAVLGPRFS